MIDYAAILQELMKIRTEAERIVWLADDVRAAIERGDPNLISLAPSVWRDKRAIRLISLALDYFSAH